MTLQGKSRPGRRRNARRRPRHRGRIGRRGRDRLCDGTHDARPSIRICKARNHRGDGRARVGGRRQGHRRPGRSSRCRRRPHAGRAHPRRAGPARHPGQRHLGRREAVRMEQGGLGARSPERPAHAAAGDRHASDHRASCAAAADRAAGRPARRGDRRHRRIQCRPLPALALLRSRQGRGEPHGLGACQGSGAAWRDRRSA